MNLLDNIFSDFNTVFSQHNEINKRIESFEREEITKFPSIFETIKEISDNKIMEVEDIIED